MGGRYPSNSAGVLPSSWPGGRPDFPLPPERRRRPLPRVKPLNPWKPPVKFPNAWKPPRVPFGKRFPAPIPFGGFNPTRFPLGRLSPWLAVGSFILPYLMAPGRPALDGWKCCFNVGPVQDAFRKATNACTPSFANLSGQVYSGDIADLHLDATTTTIFLGQWNLSHIRATHKAQYNKGVSGVPGPIPAPIPIIPPIYVSPWFELPWWDPNAWTPNSPVPFVPPPWPRWRPDPEGEPNSYPPPREVGPKNEPRSRHRPRPKPRDDRQPDVVITPDGVHDKPPFHPRRPPQPRDRERKFSGSRGSFGLLAALLLRSAGRVYGGITELVDLLSAIYSAIPADVIASHPDNLPVKDLIPFMLSSIYDNIDVIDINEAIHNLATNAIEDAAWGRYFRASSRVTDYGPNHQGFDRENSELQQLLYELYNT